MRKIYVIGILFVFILLMSCSDKGGVLSHDDFVSLLVDIHKGEAYTDINFRDFRMDSARAAYKQSILAKHGITQEEFDTTMVWYGMHIEDYLEVYDDVIAELEKEVANSNASLNASLSLIGDSVNTWTESSYYVINKKSPSQFLTFYLEKDENWEPGDSYTWQMKTFNRLSPAKWTMVIAYEDKTAEYKSEEIADDGWTKMTMVIDSLRTPVALYGYAEFNIHNDEVIYVDSVSLIRNRVTELDYRRRFNQRRFNFGIDTQKKLDDEKSGLRERMLARAKADPQR